MSNLGTNPTEQCETLNTLRSGWGTLKRTEVGHELAHVAAIFGVALDAAAGVKVIFTDHFYEGIVLYGYGFSISVNGQHQSPLESSALLRDIKSSNSHEVALGRINELLEIDEMDDTRALTSMAHIRAEVLEKGDLTRDKIVEIKKLAYSLRFRRGFWPSNPVYLGRMFEIISGHSTIDATVPIDPDMIDETDVVATVLSAFGRSCPSFIIPNGRTIDLTKGLTPPKEVILPARGKKPARKNVINDLELTIQVRLVDRNTAIENMKTLISSRQATVVPLQQAYKAGIKVFKGTDRANLFSGLQGIINLEQTIPANPLGGESAVADPPVATMEHGDDFYDL
jgi:hypothetical protein